jgi:hypothetical protein
MSDKWGVYQWVSTGDENMIHPDDLERFKCISDSSRVFKFISESNDYITLEYGSSFFRVKKDLFTEISPPRFSVGQQIEPKMRAVISDVFWHYKEKKHFYKISVAGKEKSKRYFDSDILDVCRNET